MNRWMDIMCPYLGWNLLWACPLPLVFTEEAESNRAIITEVKEQERKALLHDAYFVFCFAGITWSVSHRL